MTTFQDKLLSKTDCDEAGDYVVPNVLSPRDQVFRPDIGHTVPPPWRVWLRTTSLMVSRMRTHNENYASNGYFIEKNRPLLTVQ